MTFRLYDMVQWTSQSQGAHTTKVGQIIAIVPAGDRPDKGKYPTLYKGAGPGSSRNHESFVVQVGKKIYWPRVSALGVVGSVNNDDIKHGPPPDLAGLDE